MYLVTYNYPPIDTKDLDKPSKRQMSLIRKSCIEHHKEYKSLPDVHWFIKKAETHNDNPFAGIATKISPNKTGFWPSNPYAICIASFVFKECIEYIQWVIRHELRHCKPTTIKKKKEFHKPKYFFREHDIYFKYFFREHDIYFIDEGWIHKPKSGFFNEDFAAIACCDKLMELFRNLNGLEEYLG